MPEFLRPKIARVKSSRTNTPKKKEAMLATRAESVPQRHYNTMPNLETQLRSEVSSGEFYLSFFEETIKLLVNHESFDIKLN